MTRLDATPNPAGAGSLLTSLIMLVAGTVATATVLLLPVSSSGANGHDDHQASHGGEERHGDEEGHGDDDDHGDHVAPCEIELPELDGSTEATLERFLAIPPERLTGAHDHDDAGHHDEHGHEHGHDDGSDDASSGC